MSIRMLIAVLMLLAFVFAIIGYNIGYARGVDGGITLAYDAMVEKHSDHFIKDWQGGVHYECPAKRYSDSVFRVGLDSFYNNWVDSAGWMDLPTGGYFYYDTSIIDDGPIFLGGYAQRIFAPYELPFYTPREPYIEIPKMLRKPLFYPGGQYDALY